MIAISGILNFHVRLAICEVPFPPTRKLPSDQAMVDRQGSKSCMGSKQKAIIGTPRLARHRNHSCPRPRQRIHPYFQDTNMSAFSSELINESASSRHSSIKCEENDTNAIMDLRHPHIKCEEEDSIAIWNLRHPHIKYEEIDTNAIMNPRDPHIKYEQSDTNTLTSPRHPHPALLIPPPCPSANCSKSTKKLFVEPENPNGNAGRPYYSCPDCNRFVCFGDMRGIHLSNPECWCGGFQLSRLQVSGEKRKVPRALYYTCALGQCNFFDYCRHEWGEIFRLRMGVLVEKEMCEMGL